MQYTIKHGGRDIGEAEMIGIDYFIKTIEAAEAAGRRVDTPDLVVSAQRGSACAHWLAAWAGTFGEKRDLLVHDLAADRWFAVQGAFIARGGAGDSYTVVEEFFLLVPGVRPSR